MSERITLVVPDGTRQKIKEKAELLGQTASSLGRKFYLDGLKGKIIDVSLPRNLGNGDYLSNDCRISLPSGIGGKVLKSYSGDNGELVITQFQLMQISI